MNFEEVRVPIGISQMSLQLNSAKYKFFLLNPDGSILSVNLILRFFWSELEKEAFKIPAEICRYSNTS